ncbi:MAG: hypothetical protein RLZZ292_2871 [Bacteroidota bacterium]|jgi:uncharacterized protein (TIGR02646 family)
MKHIIKIKPAPTSFVQWLQTQTTKDFIKRQKSLFDAADDKTKGKYAAELWSAVADDNTKEIFVKTDLWLQLCREQGYICAYCGRRLDLNKQRIEHLEVKSKNIANTLDYDKLAAVCDSTNNEEGTHCDVKRGPDPIFVYPTQKNCENRIFYDINGYAIGQDAEATTTITVLGLNANSNLVRDRKKYYQNAKVVIDAYLRKHSFKKDAKFCFYLNKVAQTLLVNHENTGIAYREYCFVDLQLYKKQCADLSSLPRNL